MEGFFDLKDKQSLSAKVYQHIRNGIIEGRYKTGEFLIETKLAEELGVSRTPIREALKQLEMEELAVSIPNRGVVAQGFSPQDIDDIFTIRLLLEGQVAYWAAERIDQEGLDHLSEIVDMMEMYTRRNNPAQLANLDSEFHDCIYSASKSRVLKHVLATLHQALKSTRRSLLTMPDRTGKSLSEHRLILEALEKRLPEEAKKHMENHVRHAGHKYLDPATDD